MKSSFPDNHSQTEGAVRFIVIFLLLISLFGCSKTETGSESQPTGAKYELGTVITFGSGGDSERFRGRGWSHTEDQQTWTIGKSAKLRFIGLPLGQPLILEATLGALTKDPQGPGQPTEIYANGQKIADWQVGERNTFTARLPGNIIKNDGFLQLEFRTPKAASPRSLGINSDTRVLGVCVFDLVIENENG